MSNIKTYRPNKKARSNGTFEPNELVRAVQVTERNYITVKDWAGEFTQVEAKIDVSQKDGDVSNHRVKVKTPKGWRVAKVGDWLVKHQLSVEELKTLDIDKYPKAAYITVAKDEFLREHTVTTYAEEFNKREEHTRNRA
jgi:polyisoprenoid-binding protein YceI